MCPRLIENHPLSFTSDWELTYFQHSKNVRNPRVYKTILEQESVILQFPNYIDFFFHEKWQLKVDYMKIETSTDVRLWFEVQTIITVKKTTGAVARGDEKDSQERELNHWRSDCRELANSEFVFTELPSELSLSRTDSTWNVKSMTIYMAPERCNTNSEVNSSQMSCWRSTQRNRAANGYILVQVWIFLTSFLATAPAPSSMWWSL